MSTLQMGHLGIDTDVFGNELSLVVYYIQSSDAVWTLIPPGLWAQSGFGQWNNLSLFRVLLGITTLCLGDLFFFKNPKYCLFIFMCIKIVCDSAFSIKL